MDDVIFNIGRSLALALGFPIHQIADLPLDVRRSIRMALDFAGSKTVDVELHGRRFLGCRYHRQRDAVLVAGPFRLPGDAGDGNGVLETTPEHLEQVRESLLSAAPGLAAVVDDRRGRLELASRLEVVSSSVLAVTGELDLHTVLRRIVDLARELGGARYAALGVPDARGELIEFITSGMTPEEETAIGSRPRGKGILGLLLQEKRAIRLTDLNAHPAAVGFPPHHPAMRSFLGVPIVARGRVLGNLYLTEKRTGREFADADERLIEMLAKHAAVAIENARLYGAVEDQQARLEILVEQFPEAIMFAEADPPTITVANHQVSELFGFEVQTPVLWSELFARNQRFDTDGRPLGLKDSSLSRALEHGEESIRRDVRILRPDGSFVTVLLNARPLRNPDGSITGAVIAFQDITLIKDAEQLKDDFLSLISHELRTPLTSIQGGGMLLDREWDRLDDVTRRELVSDVAQESRRLGDLIDNMVQLANIRAGRLKLDTEPIHLRRLIEHAVSGVRQLADERTIAIDTEQDLFADADPRSVDQVLRNLLHNAVKYSPPSSVIEVSARADDGEARVSVRDHGPGIDEDDVPFVFERFRRGGRAGRSNVPGLGLGLYLSRHLVEANGGRIWVERPEDGGARFSFTLPRIDDED